MKDIVIIGLATEIEKARIIIKNFLLRQNNIAFNYSLNILFPIYFKSKLQDFLFENKEEIDKNKIKIGKIFGSCTCGRRRKNASAFHFAVKKGQAGGIFFVFGAERNDFGLF